MDKITINLLPEELLHQAKEYQQRSTIFKLSLGLLVVMIFLASALLVLRFIQNQTLISLNNSLGNSQEKVAGFKNQEGQLVFLKERLGSINSLLNQDSKTVASYNLINSLAPTSLIITTLSADKDGNILITAETPNTAVLRVFFDHLTSPSLNQGKISKVLINSLSQSGNIYRMDLAVTVQ